MALGAGVASAAAILLAVVLGAARPAPDLRAVLGETPCAAPCWHAITPGVTSLVDALRELRSDPDIEDLAITVGSASWWWSARLQDGRSADSWPFDGRMLFQNDTADSQVDGLALLTSFRLGDLRNALGPPGQHILHTFSTPERTGILYEADYGELRVFSALSCPLRPVDFWNAPVGVAFGTVELASGGETSSIEAEPAWPVERLTALCSP